jgi:hypothetical protein
MKPFRILITGLLLAVVPFPVAADRIHLKTGDYVDVDHWRDLGDKIVYERFGGEIGIFKTDIVRIERTATDPTKDQAPGSSAAKSRPPAAPATSSAWPPTVLAELQRLTAEEAKAQSYLAKIVAIQTEAIRKGLSVERAKATIKDSREPAERDYQDARKRRADFESQARAQYGPPPE